MKPVIHHTQPSGILMTLGRLRATNPQAKKEGRDDMKKLALAVAAASTAAVGLGTIETATAQTYPSKPVRLIVPFLAGGGADIVARLLGQSLSERLGQAFIIENRPGAGGNIGTEAVVRAPPDGYTLLVVTSANTINATLYERLSFDFVRDIVPVAETDRLPYVMEVNPSVPAKTVPEFIAYAKANPGKVNYASAGIGTPQHVSAELLKILTGINMVHVPYRGVAPALVDMLVGQVHVMFDVTSSSIEYIRTDGLRALAVTTTTRVGALPNIPTVADYLPGYEASSFHGVGAPRGTPAEIVDKLNKEINSVLADPGMKARLGDLGAIPLVGSPADFAKLIANEIEKWGRVVKFSGAKPD
jgi:tripartite-type tricarboxylate transporter receptor subunit TctC